jgi:A/G-specific adenine glycosylase
VLIAEILLQRTRAETVEPIFNEFIERYPSMVELRDAEEADIAGLLSPLGLHNRRASSLVKIGTRIGDDPLPTDEEELLELPHVGKYVANAVLCFAHGEPRPVVDRNVIRVYQRVFEIEEDRQRSEELWDFAAMVLPEEDARDYNLALLDFAAARCTARSPGCDGCFARSYCPYPPE